MKPLIFVLAIVVLHLGVASVAASRHLLVAPSVIALVCGDAPR